MEFAEEEKKQKQELKLMEKRLADLTQKAEELRKELKEKEQEQRISTYKLNEMRRSIKHNQLKPLKKALNGMVNSESESIGLELPTNQTLNKQVLKKHNQNVSLLLIILSLTQLKQSIAESSHSKLDLHRQQPTVE